MSQDLDPWAYGNLPLKLNSLSATYAFMKGNVISDPGAPIQDFNVTTHKIVISYLRTFNLFGKLGRVQLPLPASYMSGNAVFRGNDTSGSRTGLDDLKLRVGVNFLGSPPLEPQQFGKYRQEVILGISLVVTMPTGQYYPERIINLGTHRWGFKPELGLSLKIGQFFWETYGGIKFTTENSEYLVNKRLTQSPIYSIQTHFCHTFKNSIKVALSGTYVNGGQSSVNGNKQNDYIRHLRGGISVGMNLSQAHLLFLQMNTNLISNISLEYNMISLTYVYSWF